MSDINSIDSNYFEILELPADATLSEIRCSYLHLKRLYSRGSAVLSLLDDDPAEEKREGLLKQIEGAYSKLKEYYLSEKMEKEEKIRHRVLHKSIPEFEVFSGNALKLTREVLGLRLNEVALATGIPLEHLHNIEQERFELLPPAGYLRIYITRYAEYLSLDAARVLDDYMKVVNKRKGKFNPDSRRF